MIKLKCIYYIGKYIEQYLMLNQCFVGIYIQQYNGKCIWKYIDNVFTVYQKFIADILENVLIIWKM